MKIIFLLKLTMLGQPTFSEYFQLATRSNGTDLLSSINGLFQAGGVIGTLLLPTVSDKWGRKWALALVCSSIIITYELLGLVIERSNNIISLFKVLEIIRIDA
jgi:sugar phosphate permease